MIVRYLIAEKFDLVHVSGGSWQYKGYIAGKIAGIKIVWELNDSKTPIIFWLLYTLLSSLCDGFIYASNRTCEYYDRYTLNKIKKFIIQSPVDTMQFDPVKNYLGRPPVLWDS